ncbi:MAG: hypothetical protein JJE47_09705 [Acidimicrobiia bacterium]|nr:hypothetical protein [Acidimicrobiia bacterium]
MAKGTFGASFIAGVVLIPAAAIASVFLIGNAPPEEPIAAVVDSTLPAVVAQAEVVPPQPFLSDLDIWTACVPDAAALIEKETAGTITPVEDAALDALREICAQEGMPLDGPPAPPPISRTVYVNGPAPVTSAAPVVAVAATDEPPTDTTTTTAADTTTSTVVAAADTTTTTVAGQPPAISTQFLAARADAVTAIDAAVAANGEGDKIEEARRQLAEADSKAAQGDYWGALEKAQEAEKNAKEAISERQG